MTDNQFIKNLEYLINKYIADKELAAALINRANSEGAGAEKWIMRDFHKNSAGIEEVDGKVIKEIAFNFI
ncbi:hypothetical protein [Marinobacter sp. V034]|uniref:hypothetical protein n=1 Tax=Marinobacter sp. V034 TaxID=3459610 RepID=UPI004044050F